MALTNFEHDGNGLWKLQLITPVPGAFSRHVAAITNESKLYNVEIAFVEEGEASPTSTELGVNLAPEETLANLKFRRPTEIWARAFHPVVLAITGFEGGI